jgi:hypothetical protein
VGANLRLVMADPARRAAGRVMVGLGVLVILGTLLVAAVVVLSGGGPTDACGRFPQCLGDWRALAGLIHVAGAGALLVFTLLSVVLAVVWERGTGTRAVRGWSGIGLTVLLVTAGFGQGFASGRIPVSWAPLQFGLLAALIVAETMMVRASHRIWGAAPPRPAGAGPPGSGSDGARRA